MFNKLRNVVKGQGSEKNITTKINYAICFICLVVWVTVAKAENLVEFLRKYGGNVHSDITGVEQIEGDYAIRFQDKEAVGGYAAHVSGDKRSVIYVDVIYDEKTLAPGTYELYVRAKGNGNLVLEQKNSQTQKTVKTFKVFIKNEDYLVYYLGRLQYDGSYKLHLRDYCSSAGLYIDYVFFTPVGTYIQHLNPTVTKLNDWLEYGEGKTLVVSRSFVSPPIAINGYPLYGSIAERDRYYIDLGIWQRAELKEYDIKSISWVHEKLPPYLGPVVASSCGTYVELMPVELKALLPVNLVEQKLPKNSRILLKGLTTENTEVPLIFEIERGKNRIINIAFSLNMDLDIEKRVIMTILGYIKKTGTIFPAIDCKAQTGFHLYEGTAWEGGETDLDIKLFGGWYDHQDPYMDAGMIKKLDSILFWSLFLRNGDLTFVGFNFSNIPINTVSTMLWDTSVGMDVIKPGGMCMINRDGTTQSASYYCNINTLVQTCSSRTSQWLLESLDGQNRDHTDIFRLSTEDRTKISFMRPVFWVEEELIHAFRINGDRLELVPITVDRNILIMSTTKGNYLVYYGKIQETELKRFWDKFCVSRKDKIAIEEPDISGPADYGDVSNVHWWEF